jgi:hypothetical protein
VLGGSAAYTSTEVLAAATAPQSLALLADDAGTLAGTELSNVAEECDDDDDDDGAVQA